MRQSFTAGYTGEKALSSVIYVESNELYSSTITYKDEKCIYRETKTNRFNCIRIDFGYNFVTLFCLNLNIEVQYGAKKTFVPAIQVNITEMIENIQ